MSIDAGEVNAKDPYADFQRDLTALLNSHSMENGSDTPDFILADYLVGCLRAFDHAERARSAWGSVPNLELER